MTPGGGEQHLKEGGRGKPYQLISATPFTLGVKNAPENGVEGWRKIDDLTAVIAMGKGKWQVGRIVGFKDSSYLMETPWRVLPDSSSTAVIGAFQSRSLWIRNYSGGGMNSLSLYVGNVEQVLAGHYFRNSGMCMKHTSYGRWADAWFNEFRNCYFKRGSGIESQVHIYFRDKPPARMPCPSIVGCEWRDNVLEDIGFGIYGGSKWGDIHWREFYTQGAIMIHTARAGSSSTESFSMATC